MSRIYLVTPEENRQISLLAKIAKRYHIPVMVVQQNKMPNITLSDEHVTLNRKTIKAPASVYQYGISPDYIAIPGEFDISQNYSVFQDSQIAREQQLSHIMSILEVLSRNEGIYVANNPMRRYDHSGQIAFLLKMAENHVDIPEFLLTNDIDQYKKSVLVDEEVLWWRYPIAKSPIKSIEKRNINKLISATRDIPILFMKEVEGSFLRLFCIDDKPLLVVRQFASEYSDKREGLEKFEYYPPSKIVNNFTKMVAEYIDGFYEIDGIVDDDGRFWLIRYDPDPSFMFLGDSGKNYLASVLLDYLAKKANIKIRINAEIPQSDERKTLFLTRMIDTLIEIEKSVGRS